MPYKEAVIDLVDVMEPSAAAIDSVNTIVNDDGVLRAFNTDYQAVADLLAASSFDRSACAVIAGSGGMAKAVVAAMRDAGFVDVTVIARNPVTGKALAEKYGFRHASSIDGLRPTTLVNATPIGMAGGPDVEGLPFPPEVVAGAAGCLDVVAMPPDTPLVRAMRARGAETISGDAVIAGQAAAQFALYTGIDLTPEQVRAASEYSRA